MSRPPRVALDVSGLPEVAFGPKSITFWGTLGFMVIEGTTLAVCATSYLYLRTNFAVWPPPHVRLPDLLAPTIGVLLLLLIVVPMHVASKAAKRLDLRRVRIALAIATALTVVAAGVRAWEFAALNVRWDHDAYGSAAWAVLGFHTALLAVDLLETLVLTVLMFVGPVEEKHFTDVEDAALYQYFLSLVYVPLYVLLFLSPRWM